MCYKIFTPLGYGVLLAKNNVYDQNWRAAGLGEHPKIWDSLRISATVEAGLWARGASKKCGTPYAFLQPLKLATSNLVHKLGMGLACQKSTFRTKIGGVWVGVWVWKHPKKIWDPLLISATVEVSNFKFCTQLRFGTGLPKKRSLGPKFEGVWARGASKKQFGAPTYFCNRWS